MQRAYIKISFFGLLLTTSWNVYAFQPAGSEWDRTRSNPVPYRINTTSAPTGFQQAVINAFETWNDVSEADISFSYVGTSSGGYSQDGINTISWSATDPFPGEPEVAAETTRIVSGGKIIEADIIFDGAENFTTSGSTKV